MNQNLRAVILLIGFLAVIAISVFGGYQWGTSSKNAEMIEKLESIESELQETNFSLQQIKDKLNL